MQGVDLLTDWRAAMGGFQPVGATVMAVRLDVNALAAGTSDENTAVRLGLIVEAATGEAEVPDPVAEPFADWMMNHRIYIDGTTIRPYQSAFPLVIKSRRRLAELGETLWLMMTPELGTATSVDVSVHARALLALP